MIKAFLTRVLIQFFSAFLIIRHKSFYKFPESLSMMFNLDVAQFMKDNIVDTFFGSHNKQQVQCDPASIRKASPTACHTSNHKAGQGNFFLFSLLMTVCQPFPENDFGLIAIPAVKKDLYFVRSRLAFRCHPHIAAKTPDRIFFSFFYL